MSDVVRGVGWTQDKVVKPPKYEKGPTGTCKNCTRGFKRKAGNQVYCSPGCRGAGLTLTGRFCEECKKTYRPVRQKQRFCNAVCKAKWHRIVVRRVDTATPFGEAYRFALRGPSGVQTTP